MAGIPKAGVKRISFTDSNGAQIMAFTGETVNINHGGSEKQEVMQNAANPEPVVLGKIYTNPTAPTINVSMFRVNAAQLKAIKDMDDALVTVEYADGSRFNLINAWCSNVLDENAVTGGYDVVLKGQFSETVSP